MKIGIIFGIIVLFLTNVMVFGQDGMVQPTILPTVQPAQQDAQPTTFLLINPVMVGSGMSISQINDTQRQAKFGTGGGVIGGGGGATTQPSGTTKIISNTGNKSSFASGAFTRNTSGGFTKASDFNTKIDSKMTTPYSAVPKTTQVKPQRPAFLGIGNSGKITVVTKPPKK